MTKKNSSNNSNTKTSARRGSVIDKTNIKIVDNDHGNYSNDIIQAQHVEESKTTWDELKSQVSTPEEIRDLVRRLPFDAVLPLLSELLTKFNSDTTRDIEVTAWLKTVLLIHTGYFMTLPNMVGKLSNLYKSLNTDMTVYPKLLSMRGRLDLVQKQIDARYRQDDESDMDEDDDDEEEEERDDDDDDDDDDDESGMGQNGYSESENSDDEDGDDDDLLSAEDVDMNTTEMFAEEEEDDLNTEDDDASDSDIDEEE